MFLETCPEPRTCIAVWLLPGCPPWLKSTFPLSFLIADSYSTHNFTSHLDVQTSPLHVRTWLCLSLFKSLPSNTSFPPHSLASDLCCVPGLRVLAMLCPWNEVPPVVPELTAGYWNTIYPPCQHQVPPFIPDLLCCAGQFYPVIL